jgi:hypothetical protein
MAEPEMARGKHSAVIFPLGARLVRTEQKPNSSRTDKNTPSEFAKSNPRLGHAASRIRQGKPLREDKPAAGYVLEPRPTKAIEDSLPDIASRLA